MKDSRIYFQMTNYDIYNFISRFTNNSSREQVIDTFSNGCCFWFAFILHNRFPDSTIVYDQIQNHFGCKIAGVVFDISGDVTSQYDWEVWENMDDELLVSRIYRDCINF